ncbi:MAG: MBL fold metallo-hydrolase [Caldilineales bacterium]|nr:MBL fold metallo-hydrolase [Caldilineales bacterium]MDW8319284.1 MBL fold metallo-hydrolase [Anaerolineae bacterium]
MLVVPGLHLVDGMEKGVVNAYVWERPDGGLTLIDAGMPKDAAKILAFVQRLGLNRLDRIIVTHGDVDHVGGLAEVQAATAARVICHAVEKEVVEGRKPREMGRSPMARVYGPLVNAVSRTVLGYRPLAQVHELVLDKTFLAPEGFQVVHVPGHSPGQIALFEPKRGILIVGDALNNRDDRLGEPPRIATPLPDVARASIRKLAQLPNVQVIVFGHGVPITENAAQRLSAFAGSLPQ